MQQAELPQLNSAQHFENPGAAWSSAMAAGDFAAAWAASDAVLARRPPGERDDPAQPYHLRWVWDGTAVDGRDILVRCYHGLGDTLQFCRYLPALRRRAAHVTLEVQAELVPLMALVGGADRIVPFDPASPLPPSACDIEIMELAHALRIVPDPAPYLPRVSGLVSSSRDALASWRSIGTDRAGGPGLPRRYAPRSDKSLQVGLCWRAHAGWRPERSISDDGAACIMVDGVAWQSLQKGAALPGMAACPDVLLDTARVIGALDLVITVDTMVAHLTGAIGVPVWLLLDTVPDWRWLAGGRGSVWYDGIRKYRQGVPGDWAGPLRAVVDDLSRRVQAGTVEG